MRRIRSWNIVGDSSGLFPGTRPQSAILSERPTRFKADFLDLLFVDPVEVDSREANDGRLTGPAEPMGDSPGERGLLVSSHGKLVNAGSLTVPLAEGHRPDMLAAPVDPAEQVEADPFDYQGNTPRGSGVEVGQAKSFVSLHGCTFFPWSSC